jgi:excisionase family DNA binding protein
VHKQADVELLTLREVARLLRCHRGTIYRAVKDGRLRPLRLAPHGPMRFKRADIEALTRNPAGGPGGAGTAAGVAATDGPE